AELGELTEVNLLKPRTQDDHRPEQPAEDPEETVHLQPFTKKEGGADEDENRRDIADRNDLGDRNIRHRIEPQPDADAMKEATEHEKLRIIAADAPRPVLYHHRQNEKGAHEIADESGFGCRESAAEIANDAVHRHKKKCRQYHPHDPLQGCTVLQTT